MIVLHSSASGHMVGLLVVVLVVLKQPRPTLDIMFLGTTTNLMPRVHLTTSMNIRSLEQQVDIKRILVHMMFLGAQQPGAVYGASIVCKTSSNISHESLMSCGPSTITSSTSGTCERQ